MQSVCGKIHKSVYWLHSNPCCIYIGLYFIIIWGTYREFSPESAAESQFARCPALKLYVLVHSHHTHIFIVSSNRQLFSEKRHQTAERHI